MRTTVVVPCFNEAARLRFEGFAPLWEGGDAEALFVDDGSTDDTARVLEAFSERSGGGCRWLAQSRNAGKGEAVRAGLREALAGGAEVVGYLDADLATSAAEMRRLLEVRAQRGAEVVLGSRVKLLGTSIERSARRHVMGRVFATCAALTLDLPAYDTQCGAKAFLRTPALEEALRRPFRSRWAFDVELLGRLLHPADAPPIDPGAMLEVPLARWADVPGSKVTPWAILRSGADLAALLVELRLRRGASR